MSKGGVRREGGREGETVSEKGREGEVGYVWKKTRYSGFRKRRGREREAGIVMSEWACLVEVEIHVRI